jgi:hypothetical protein
MVEKRAKLFDNLQGRISPGARAIQNDPRGLRIRTYDAHVLAD